MEPIKIHTGIAAPLDRANVDTDAIIGLETNKLFVGLEDQEEQLVGGQVEVDYAVPAGAFLPGTH